MALNWGEIATTTIEKRSRKLADNVLDNVALLMRLKEKGNRRPISGGSKILEELLFDEFDNFKFYSGYETLDTTQNQVITSAEFDIKQAVVGVSISGLEELQNDGDEATIDLLEGRIKAAEKTMMNKLDQYCYDDGTSYGGKAIDGLQAMIPDDPTTGTYGGISASETNWRSVKYSGVTDGGAAVSAANIKRYSNALRLQLIRGNEKPDFGLADNNYYSFWLEALQAIQQVSNPKLAEAGFENIRYAGMDIVCGGGLGGAIPANHFYMITSDYVHYRPHRKRDMVLIGKTREPVNQDAMIKYIGWAGNLTCSNRRQQGVLKA